MLPAARPARCRCRSPRCASRQALARSSSHAGLRKGGAARLPRSSPRSRAEPASSSIGGCGAGIAAAAATGVAAWRTVCRRAAGETGCHVRHAWWRRCAVVAWPRTGHRCWWHAGGVKDRRDDVPGYRMVRVGVPEAPVAALADVEAWQARGAYPDLQFGGPLFGVAREREQGGWELHGTSARWRRRMPATVWVDISADSPRR